MITLLLTLLLVVFSISNGEMDLVLLQDPETVCIDGSPAGYYFQAGSETGSYLVFLQGGGVCETPADCYARSLTSLGSSKSWAPTISSIGGGFVSFSSSNPLSKWNIISVPYCDGGRYSSDAAEPLAYNNTNLYFRGKKNVLGVIADLMANKGLSQGTELVLSGCSAGGEGTYYMLDHVRDAIPSRISVKGMADAGWFLDTNNVTGKPSPYFAELPTAYTLWNSSATLKPECLAKFPGEEWRCLFAMHFYDYITTPIFITQSQIDTYQLGVLYELPCAGDLSKCTQQEFQSLYKWAATFRASLQTAIANPTTGIFVDACPTHCQSQGDNSWDETYINKQSIADAFWNWYTTNSTTKYEDVCTDYPCNISCS
eukprot:TRINITY_DN2178_c0_g1_i1.p1 TRINITY_DN2178_c0_g1~~TRINITY_DN2178_c0_g1_i1.p1  ORF type:complete len:371 (+),score=80.84 TRINITY_DN2178_c0_g1_i1:3-1115(+)